MIKILLIVTFIICCQLLVFGQPKKSRKTIKLPPPPIYKPLALKPHAKNKIEEALTDISPKAFAWKIETAGNVPAKTLFRQYVELRLEDNLTEFSVKAKINSEFNTDAFDLKEGADIREAIISQEISSKNYSVKIEKDVLTLTDDKTKNIERFKVFLDKTQKKILKLQNLNNQKIYIPTAVEYPAPMLAPN